MPIKKEMKKKSLVKPKKRAAKKKQLPKAKPIQIITQKLPKEKCCTDPIKSGQAYTIPLGFTDRLGAMPVSLPLQQTTQPTQVTTYLGSVKTQTEKPITLSKGTQIKKGQFIIEGEDKPISIQTQTEKPITLSKGTQIKIGKIIIEDEDEPISIQTQTLEETTKEKRKYDTSKSDTNKMRLLSQLYNLLILNYSEENTVGIVESYKFQSNKKIKEKLDYERQIARKK